MSLHIVRSHPRKATVRTALVATAAWSLLSGSAFAGQLLYTPVNPSFGGNPLNGPNLLQSAQAQKSYPFPMDDLGLDNIGQIIQTSSGFLIQKGNQLYWFNPSTGASYPINLGDTTINNGPGTGGTGSGTP